MNNITFRSITPLFQFTINQPLTISGELNSFPYEIKIGEFPRFSGFHQYSDEYLELLKYAPDKEEFYKDAIQSQSLLAHNETFLVVDVTQPLSNKNQVSTNSLEQILILQACFASLRLNASKGIMYGKTFDFRSLPYSYSGFGNSVSKPLINFYPFPRLGDGLSVLDTNNASLFEKTFLKLLGKTWNKNIPIENVLELALEYHRISFTMERIEHCFLVLMVIFEALFKKDDNENASRASLRLAKFLSKGNCLPRNKRDRQQGKKIAQGIENISILFSASGNESL